MSKIAKTKADVYRLLQQESEPTREAGEQEKSEDVRRLVDQCERPRCELCGGSPQLGQSYEGRVRSLCRKCADEDYLDRLTPEERALLRK